MSRGGSRPGSGRPRRIIPPEVEVIGRPDLAERLRDYPATTLGRRRRVALILASRDAPAEEIALALGVSEPKLRLQCGYEITAGRSIALGGLIDAMWALARTGNVAAIKFLMRRMDDLARDDGSREFMKRLPPRRPAKRRRPNV